MSDFPENDIEILPDFLSEDLNSLWEPMRRALSAAAVPITGPITEPNADRVDQTLFNQILSTRQRLGQFLSHQANLTNLGKLGTQFKHRDFDEALNTIKGSDRVCQRSADNRSRGIFPRHASKLRRDH
jgi:hypothetical protein